jgi:hypothetical protein
LLESDSSVAISMSDLLYSLTPKYDSAYKDSSQAKEMVLHFFNEKCLPRAARQSDFRLSNGNDALGRYRSRGGGGACRTCSLSQKRQAN